MNRKIPEFNIDTSGLVGETKERFAEIDLLGLSTRDRNTLKRNGAGLRQLLGMHDDTLYSFIANLPQVGPVLTENVIDKVGELRGFLFAMQGQNLTNITLNASSFVRVRPPVDTQQIALDLNHSIGAGLDDRVEWQDLSYIKPEHVIARETHPPQNWIDYMGSKEAVVRNIILFAVRAASHSLKDLGQSRAFTDRIHLQGAAGLAKKQSVIIFDGFKTS